MKIIKHRLMIAAATTALAATGCSHAPQQHKLSHSIRTVRPAPPINWHLHTVQQGDTLSSIFSNFGLNDNTTARLMALGDDTDPLSSLQIGDTIRVELSQQSQLKRIVLERDDQSLVGLVLGPTAKGFRIKGQVKSDRFVNSGDQPVTHGKRVAHVSGIVKQSFVKEAKSAGMPGKIVAKLKDIFAGEIDFTKGLRSGDQYTVLFEAPHLRQKRSNRDPLLAVEVVEDGEIHQAVRYRDERGHIAYYTPEGESLQPTFLREPMKRYKKISSRFNPRRRHPISGRVRAHNGTDFSADTGTPVQTTADGVISFRGWRGGYGRVVIVDHSNGINTLYAHLSRFGSRITESSHVKQGQTIGYVGRSGAATGSHLHFEFRINGVAQDPMRVALSAKIPKDRTAMARFRKQTRPLMAQLKRLKSRPAESLAMAKPEPDSARSEIAFQFDFTNRDPESLASYNAQLCRYNPGSLV